MRQKRIRLTLTRGDAAALTVMLRQAVEDEPGLLIQSDKDTAVRIENRQWRLLQPRSHLELVEEGQ